MGQQSAREGGAQCVGHCILFLSHNNSHTNSTLPTPRCGFCSKGFYANADPGNTYPQYYPLTVSTAVPDATGATHCVACPAGYFTPLASESRI